MKLEGGMCRGTEPNPDRGPYLLLKPFQRGGWCSAASEAE